DAATPGDGTTATASAATRGTRMLLASCIVGLTEPKFLLLARHPPRCLAEVYTASPSHRGLHTCALRAHISLSRGLGGARMPTLQRPTGGRTIHVAQSNDPHCPSARLG